MKEYITDLAGIFESPILSAIVIFLIYLLLAKIADIFTDKVVRRLTKFTRTGLDDRVIDLLHRPVFIHGDNIRCVSLSHYTEPTR